MDKQNFDPCGQPLSRKGFIKKMAGLSGISAAVGYLALAPEHWPWSRRDHGGLRSLRDRSQQKALLLPDFRVDQPPGPAIGIGRGSTAEQRLRRALDAIGGLQKFISKGDIVLVKPNVAFDRSPGLGATTHPEILSALITLLLQDCQAQEVRITDNPIESPADCFRKSGISQATEQAGGRIFLPDNNAFKVVHTPNATLIEYWSFLHRPFTNVDKVIGLSPVKDHNLCQASLGIKNWYGLLGGKRNQFHQNIHTIIADLSLLIKPTLTILDGSHILMKNGPTGGDPRNVKAGDTVLAGTDPVAMDAWAFEHLLERGKNYPEYLNLCEQKGSGRVDYQGRIKIVT